MAFERNAAAGRSRRLTVARALAGAWVVGSMAGWSASAAGAEPPRLGIPVDCALGRDCFVQNYFDVDPGPGAGDHACGRLANDGHQGTDFRVRDLLDVERGVAVLAAAAGRVATVRDGIADGFPDELGTLGSPGRECGNGVVLDHGGGWRTQYCHLRQGSVSVAPGEAVEAGEPLGMVGMSGLAEFPHLHLTVWRGERAVDPFLGPETWGGAAAGCRGPRQGLWREEAMRRLAYQASGVLNAGFASRAPSLRGIERGGYGADPPTARSDLWFYARMFGLQPGDRQRLRVFGPQERLVMEWTSAPAESAETLWLQPIGRQAPADGWPAGRYRGEFILIRNGAVVLESLAEVEIR